MQENQKAQLQIYSQESTKRTEILLKKNLELLSQNQISYTFDYTFWDDMVRFVNEPDSVWAKRNIISSIQTYKLNCAWVFNSTFKPIFFHNNDYDEKDIKQFFLEPETVKKIFSKGKFPHFFLKTEKYLLEIACAPIQYSNDLQREGTAQGYYITGRIWDDEYLNEIHKINNSKVFLAFPGIYSEVQTNETNIDQPEIILAKTPLLDYSGNVISYLISRHVDKGIYGLLKENQKQLPLFLIYGVVFLFTITLSLIFWVVKPLKIISIGLVSGETEKIRNLSTHKTEFGNFASLLIKFFRQKNILETEITVREKIEIELLEVKKNLEVQVENRTLKLTELNKKLIGEQKQTKMYFDSSGSIICLLDKNGNIKLVNRYGCNLLYYTESEVIGKNCFRDLLTKSSAKELYPVFKNYLSEKPAHIKPYIAYVLTKHNQVKIILINNFYNKINDDGTTELLFSAIDVTDLKKAEKELKDKEQRYRLLVETQVDPICRWLLDTTITFVNKSFCAFFGKQQLELLGSRWIDLISKDYHNKVIAKHENVTKEVSVIEYEVEVFKPDGTKHWMLWTDTPLRDNRGVITEYQSIARDISKSKAAEINLRKLSSAVVQSPVSIVITDVSGNIEYVNPKFTQVTGYTLAEVKGQNPRILKSGDQGKEFYKDLWDTILEGKIWKGEFRNKKKNGDLFWESGHISPITDEKGSVTHFIAVKEDITEKKKMLSELISSKESAERSNKLKDAFIANISHEIRTPLNGILGMTNIIKEMLSPHIGKDDEIFFEGIEISSKRIIRTIDMIINYSRVLVGEFKTEQKNNNLDQICRNLIKEYGYLASAKSLELIYENKYGMANIFGDEYAITQSISNLMENAIKFTQEGFVKITLYKDENGDIKLDISDTGIGIKNEYIQYIFEPYRQEEMGYGRKYEGVGLGLALVKKLINLNNFSISVSSLKGAGSTFTINFGSSTTAFKNLEDVYKPIISHQDQKKSKDYLVLIVEDDPINQLLIKNFIMKEYKVLITDTSDNVIEILEQNNVDLILMDISIKGGKNGLELAKEIKMIPKFSNIPIIATTAHVFSNDRQNAIEYKCDDFLPKPFTRKGLLDTIHKFVKVESIGNYKIEVS